MESVSFAALLFLATIAFSNYRSGTLGPWLRSKFFNQSPTDVPPALVEARGVADVVGPAAVGALGGGFVLPVRGQVISVLGDPRDGGARRHEGVDIGAGKGTPVRAARAGRVTHAAGGGKCGLRVDIAHGDGWLTRYCHLDELAVRKGQRVEAGAVIGTVGLTGNAAGGAPHLHFEVRRHGTALDPLDHLPALSGATP